MKLEEILNEALNEAMCNTNRIKSPNSNKIAAFVIEFMASKELKSDSLHDVSKCSCFRPLGKTRDGVHCYDCNAKLR